MSDNVSIVEIRSLDDSQAGKLAGLLDDDMYSLPSETDNPVRVEYYPDFNRSFIYYTKRVELEGDALDILFRTSRTSGTASSPNGDGPDPLEGTR